MAAIAVPRSKRIGVSGADEVRERRDGESSEPRDRKLAADGSGSDSDKLVPRLRDFGLRVAKSAAFLRSLVRFHSRTRRLGRKSAESNRILKSAAEEIEE